MITDQDKEEIVRYFEDELMQKYKSLNYFECYKTHWAYGENFKPSDFLQKALYRLQIDQHNQNKILLKA